MKKIAIPNWYCAALHAGLAVVVNTKTGDFNFSPCAHRPVEFSGLSDQTFNHSELIKIRQKNIQQKKLPGPCLSCVVRNPSPKDAANEAYIKDKLLYNQTGPKIITFSPSVVCNLACTTCGSGASSKWAAITKNSHAYSSGNTDKIRKLIRNTDLTNLETVHFFGGEPFADNKIHNAILEELSDFGKNITVWYDTNATFVPNKQTMKLWEKFHLIRIKFSIDGVGESFEYLRWPAKWSDVQKNMLEIKQTCPVNVMFGFRPAIGFLNLHKIKDIRDWFDSNLSTNRLGDRSDFEYNGVMGTFAPQNITEEMKNDLLKIYTDDDPVITHINSSETHSITATVEEIKEKLQKIDKIRGTDYKKSLPYLSKYL